MRIKIRDWDIHFEADRSRKWKKLSWVPIPNKQGLGYKKIMHEKNGAEIFGCWIALVEQGSICSPRGDLSRYSIEDLSEMTIIPLNILNKSIEFIIQHLDWIEVIKNLDINVNDLDINVNECPQIGHDPHVVSSILSSSLLSSSIKGGVVETKPEKKKYIDFVFLTDAEYSRLRSELGQSFLDACIEKLDAYLSNDESKRKKYKDHNKVIRNWVIDSVKEKMQPKPEEKIVATDPLKEANEKLNAAKLKYDIEEARGEPEHRLEILKMEIQTAREERDEIARKTK